MIIGERRNHYVRNAMPAATLTTDDTLLDDTYAMTAAVLRLRDLLALDTEESPETFAARWIEFAEVQWRRSS